MLNSLNVCWIFGLAVFENDGLKIKDKKRAPNLAKFIKNNENGMKLKLDCSKLKVRVKEKKIT